MSRSFSNLRRALFGIAFVGSLGFGVGQAFAEPRTSPARQPYCHTNEIRCYCMGWSYCSSTGCFNPDYPACLP